MVEGERRTIVVPPSQGYTDDFVSTTGRSSENGVSVQGKTLIYDVELVNIL
jgi:FKBP-type peptidyl-prolyl cis-trans isomerase